MTPRVGLTMSSTSGCRLATGFAPVLAVDEVLHHACVERARAIERAERDDVLEHLGPVVLEELLHARRLELEHAGGLAALQELVGELVVEWQRPRSSFWPSRSGRAFDEPHRDVEHGERLQAEEVELDQPRLLGVVLVVLGDDLAFVQEARHVIPERTLADDDAGGVLAGVAREPFELLRDLDELARNRILFDAQRELGLDLERLGDGVHLPLHLGVRRDQAGQRLGLVGRHAHRASHVFDHAARLELVERRDLSHRLAAVFFADVVDDLVAAIHAEVDVEVGHRDALGVQEALEEQAVRDGVEIGDAHRVRDERSRARAAARPDRDAALFGVADEVPHDEEVSRETHLHDDVNLGLEALLVERLIDDLSEHGELLKAMAEPFARDVREVVAGVEAFGHFEVRQHRPAELELEPAAHLGDGHRRCDRLGQLAKAMRHLVGALEVHLRRVVVAGFGLGVGAPDCAQVR